jgi:flagellar hook protein FlgE
LNISLDFSDITFLSGDNTLALFSQDGFPIGTLEDFYVGNDGVVTGAFSNGLTRVLAQVPLAIFPNQEGLLAVGNNFFVPSFNTGEHIIGQAGLAGRGTITQGFLEGSNTDMATEFTGIIVTQRGFQANARTITVADNMLEEIIGLAR